MDINQLQQASDLSEGGVWVQMDDAEFLIRSTDSKRYRAIVNKIAKRKNQGRLRRDAEAQHELTVEALAEGILIDFKGVKENGRDLPCTPENKLKLCRIEVIRSFLATEAQDLANFQREAAAEDASDLKSVD